MRWGEMWKIYNDIGKGHSRLLSRSVLGGLAVLALGAVAFAPWAKVSADTVPSGEVQFNKSSIEPAYNDLTGKFTYFMTPKPNTLDHSNSHAVAKLYIIMYPTSAASSLSVPLNCQRQPIDNCPSHSDAVAGFAAATKSAVYDYDSNDDVLGHDHLLSAPPSPRASGGDFNIAWLPVVVLFNSPSDANTHITTLDQLNTAIANHDVTEYPLPDNTTFQCVIVPKRIYEMGIPAY